jgi:GH15 family glucan-1,4-alpha-glucosidase
MLTGGRCSDAATIVAPAMDLSRVGLIGNCQISALVDASGAIVWCCWPRFDGDPIFGTLLAGSRPADGGEFAVVLKDVASSTIEYRRNTAILETTLEDAHGNALKIIDYAPRFRRYARNFRPAMLIRRVMPLRGRPLVHLRISPREDYGARELTLRTGSHHIRFLGVQHALRLTTDASITHLVEQRPFVLDRTLSFVLTNDEILDQAPQQLASDYLQQTTDYWNDWVRGLAIPFEWQEATIRAAITLKLCAFEDTGAVIAAPTTSIPEHAGSTRNWDYRFCWLRDAYFTVQALNRLGATRTMEAFLSYIDDIVAREPASLLQPVYGLAGESELTEREIPHLAGYCDMGPVRVGNLAYQQRQHDVYGAVVLGATQSFFDERLTSRGDTGQFERLEKLGVRARELVDAADAGLWEFRGIARRHTFSAAMCFAAADRLSRIAARLGRNESAARWRMDAEQMRDHVLRSAWRADSQRFSASFDADVADASMLLLPELGLVEWRDPRFVKTLESIERELLVGDFLLRYREPDDFGVPNNAFTVCSFWWANALAAMGRTQEARDLFCKLLARRNAVGLLSEDIDPTTGALWGNFPQTYSMVGIVTTAMRLSRRWEDEL